MTNLHPIKQDNKTKTAPKYFDLLTDLECVSGEAKVFTSIMLSLLENAPPSKDETSDYIQTLCILQKKELDKLESLISDLYKLGRASKEGMA